MNNSLLTTKFFIPPTRPERVSRPRLVALLDTSAARKLTLISAPAGFGKSTLLAEWLNGIHADDAQVAWLSLDPNDNEPGRFLAYFLTSIHQAGEIGQQALDLAQSTPLPPVETIFTALINQAVGYAGRMVVVLDDYHVIEDAAIHAGMQFLLENLPPQLHLVIATREDPLIPLARLRGRREITELRAADLRFTAAEATAFLNQGMGLNLSDENITALENRTEGWITGLQLAAISLQGQEEATGFIQSFTGSNRFVLDYLVEEVLAHLGEDVRRFLLQTAVLERLNGSLCDAVTGQTGGQQTLESLEQANLFIIPLDNDRQWYRYHHLFADLLRHRLHSEEAETVARELHKRASVWYQENDYPIEAFQHASASGDIDRAAELIEGGGISLEYRGAQHLILPWLEALPDVEMEARPALLVTYASALTMAGQPLPQIEEKLAASESMLKARDADPDTHDLIGQIALIRAMLAIPGQDTAAIIREAQRALENLHPENLSARTTATWALGYAHHLQGERRQAAEVFRQAVEIAQTSGNRMVALGAATGLGQVQEAQNELFPAGEAYQQAIQFAGEPPLPVACEGHLGLARLYYEWNDLETSHYHTETGAALAAQVPNVDTPIDAWLMRAKISLAQGDAPQAVAHLKQAEQFLEQNHFRHRLPDVEAQQVRTLLVQGDLRAASCLADAGKAPLNLARVALAAGEPETALDALAPFRQQAEEHQWGRERLQALILEAMTLQMMGDTTQALAVFGEALSAAEPGGLVRSFVDAGPAAAELLSAARLEGLHLAYTDKLLFAFGVAEDSVGLSAGLVEPLSTREMEVLGLIAEGLSNREIGERLYLALDTVKGHNRRIFGKLQVQRRTEAVARARELGLI